MALAVLCACLAAALGCAGRQGSSFETLGIPEVEDRPGRSPIVVGWAHEERSGWVVRRVRVDGETMPQWNEETERPSVMYLTPGTRSLQLYTAQLRDPSDRSSRSRRRYRTRPVDVELEEGFAQICVIRLEGERRRRPNVRCESREILGEEDEYEDEDEYGDEYEDEEGEYGESDEGQVASAEPASGQDGDDEDVPDPFGGPAPSPTTTQAAPTAPASPPSASPPASTTAPPAAPSSPEPPPRRLSVEERIDRLERQVEELRRQLRQR
jgi:hypothetical protein